MKNTYIQDKGVKRVLEINGNDTKEPNMEKQGRKRKAQVFCL
jgi:hypothetical protein